MIERFGRRAAIGKRLMSLREFFTKAADDYSIAPNLEPHPSLASFRKSLLELELPKDGTRVLMDLAGDEDEPPVAVAIVIVSPRPQACFQSFAASFRADGVVSANQGTVRRVGDVPKSHHVWHIIWD